MFQENSQESLDEARQYLKDIFDDYGLIFDSTPLIFFVGSLESLDSCLVLLNSTYYSFADPLESVEFCFQAYKAFQTPKNSFPEISKHIWSFLQKSIYEIRLDRSVACANSLWVKVKKLMKDQPAHAIAA